MVRKQRDLVKEIENLTNTFRGVEDKNRSLVVEIDNMSRKIRDMEDTFRREKEEIIRKCEREKKDEIDSILREKDNLERRLEEMIRSNRDTENTIRDLEYELKDLKNQLDRANKEKTDVVERLVLLDHLFMECLSYMLKTYRSVQWQETGYPWENVLSLKRPSFSKTSLVILRRN